MSVSIGLRVLRLVDAHAPLPVGETGGSREQGRMAGRGITPPAQAKRGRLGKPCQEAKLYPCATRGAASLSGIGVAVFRFSLAKAGVTRWSRLRARQDRAEMNWSQRSIRRLLAPNW